MRTDQTPRALRQSCKPLRQRWCNTSFLTQTRRVPHVHFPNDTDFGCSPVLLRDPALKISSPCLSTCCQIDSSKVCRSCILWVQWERSRLIGLTRLGLGLLATKSQVVRRSFYFSVFLASLYRLHLFSDIVMNYQNAHFTEILPPMADLCDVDGLRASSHRSIAIGEHPLVIRSTAVSRKP